MILTSQRARGLYADFGLSGDKVVVIPNFVDDIGFTPETPPGTEWVYIGRLAEEKGIVNLLKHWPSSETLNIYGDGPLRAEVVAAARPNVKYHGHLDHHDVPSVLAAARGLIFPSECAEGGLPLSYVESLAAGRIIVAKAGSSASDDLVFAGSGSVFETWNDLPGALLAATSQAQMAGKRGRQHYETHYRRDAFLARTHKLYSELLAEAQVGLSA